MPCVPPFDTDMTDAHIPTTTATKSFGVPLRVNGHADITFTSSYDPSISGQESPAEDRTTTLAWTMEGSGNGYGLVGGGKPVSEGKGKERNLALPVSSLKTGLCYDVRMMYHTQIFENEHPEQPKRIFLIYKALVDAMLLVDPEISGVSEEPGLMTRIGAREVTYEEAMLAHSEEHWEYLASTAGTWLGEISFFAFLLLTGSIYSFNIWATVLTHSCWRYSYEL